MKRYRCPDCGRTITEKEYLEELKSPDSGYCYCRFSALTEADKEWLPRMGTEMVEITKDDIVLLTMSQRELLHSFEDWLSHEKKVDKELGFTIFNLITEYAHRKIVGTPKQKVDE